MKNYKVEFSRRTFRDSAVGDTPGDKIMTVFCESDDEKGAAFIATVGLESDVIDINRWTLHSVTERIAHE
ncbi:hypothetical protein FWH13_03005 [Candidatus Saccharibacteria bacterium]|nr:hypothetical protein [Candidatus Saccharibacteria bacterium]